MLRRPKMPSVIIETHHAWHYGETEQWGRADTVARFGEAVNAAVDDLLAAGAPATGVAD